MDGWIGVLDSEVLSERELWLWFWWALWVRTIEVLAGGMGEEERVGNRETEAEQAGWVVINTWQGPRSDGDD